MVKVVEPYWKFNAP